MTWDDGLRIWRVVVLALGAFDIGFALTMAYVYVRGHKDPGPYRKIGHVLAITASYVMLCAAVWIVIAERAANGDPITWRLPVASVAFPLGVYALTQLLHHSRKAELTGVQKEAAEAKARAVAVVEALERIARAVER